VNDLNRLVLLFGKVYRWDRDPQLDRCSMTSHCFVSNRHTGIQGCARPPSRLVLAKV
jgi:hypothetical protein